jgi:hypothetical protein
MRLYNLILITALSFFAIYTSAQNNVTFQVDMSTVDSSTFTTPEVNGDFNGWCGSCASMTDANGDNIWDITVDLANGSYEFKYSADNWGIQESLLPGSPCTVTNFGFTNRILTISGDTTLPIVCWESCDDCSAGPSAYNVTFEVDMRGVSSSYTTPEVNGEFNSWCGNCWQMDDSDGDSIWQFTTVFAPGDSLEWKYSVDNWTIQEDLDSSLSCIIVNYDPGAPNGYGFVNRVAVINSDTIFSAPWNSCGTIGIAGCTDTLAANYDSLATTDDGSCLYSSTFNVNMNCDTSSFTEVNLESPNFGWCGGCVIMTDPDGDGIHSVTVDLPLGDFEYKYGLDSWTYSEDLIDDMQNGGSCAPITDYSSYANRQVTIMFGTTTQDSYGSCDICVGGCTDSLAVNFDSIAMFNDGSCTYCVYGCMNPAALNYDSLATCADSCIFPQVTYGCTDSTALNYNPLATIDDTSCVYCLFGCMDSLACNYDALATCDDGSCLTIYGCTDSLACNFNPQANCDDGSCSTIYGCTDSLANNYDVLATCDDGSCVYGFNVTFQLDLRNVSSISYTAPEINGMFNGWCGNCAQLEDLNNDSIWDITILIDSGSYEYKYSADNFTIEENLFSGDSCTVSNFGFTNRLIHVSKDTVLDPVCWELCDDCNSGPSSYNVTFRLDMSEYVGPPFSTPEVNGTFNNWCGSCWAMDDSDGDNIWEFTALLAAGDTVEYKFSADNWSMQEDLDSSLSCITIAYDPGAANGWGYVNRSKVITSETVLDVVCWNECIECQGQTGIENVLVEEMQIYPNPSTGSFYIKSKSSIEKIIIYNSIGELVFVKEPLLNSREHNISINKNGLYFISIYKGGQITNKKLTILK